MLFPQHIPPKDFVVRSSIAIETYMTRPFATLILILCLISCEEEKVGIAYKVLSPSSTGIHFSNTITANDSINLVDYYYIYNGGGVGVGDLNNDNLPDLFFSGNMVGSKLYMNKGAMQFEDITSKAGMTTDRWAMGVSMVDINADGWLDIYVNIAGHESANKKNLLFINQGLNEEGIPTFLEKANDYGIADASFSVQSAFFDYDGDGDLDLFILTNCIDTVDKTFIYDKAFAATKGQTIDRLYENLGTSDGMDHPYFVEKSLESGIVHEGYGLGLAINDLNDDGWPDIYVANDFMPNDRLYINQGNKSFKDLSEDYLRHQSYNGMGVDIADVNNDLLPDIMVLDMLPDNNDRRKSMLSGMHPKKFRLINQAGYIPQYVRNTLQLNRGTDLNGDIHFSEIGQLGGIHATDWSWAPLLADFDNDGDRDIFISNGFVKDMTDLDFINYDANNSYFGTKEAKQNRTKELYKIIPEVKIPNFLYQNNGDLTYSDVSKASGVGIPSFSNGAIFSDLDGDGDLDIVTNDIDHEALVYQNITENKNNYLKVRLNGATSNRNATGAKVYVEHNGSNQYAYVAPTRGYLSSMNDAIHFGLGKDTIIDKIEVIWPDGTHFVQRHIPVNQTVEINHQKGDSERVMRNEKNRGLFTKVVDSILDHRHEENMFNDFDADPLLLKMYSRGGPTMTAGPLDGKKGADIYIGGSYGNVSSLFVQDSSGKFRKQEFPESSAQYEDMDSFLFDSDNDGDNDLYVVSGGSEHPLNSPFYQDRLYINNGLGHFEPSNKLPPLTASGGCVAGADYDQDGDIDLFVGGRYSPGQYPMAPESYLLNNNSGNFSNVAEQVAGLSGVGMVSDAIWSDYDGDGWEDLLLVGEWMPLTIFKNDNGTLKRISLSIDSKSTGWWNTIQAADFDNDGDTDYVVGNLGLNQDYKATPDRPFLLYADDFDENGKVDPLFACYMKSTATGGIDLFPYHGLDDLAKQVVAYKKIFKTYQAYSEASFDNVLTDNLTKKALKLEAKTFASTLFINDGNNSFTMRELPIEAQMGPIFAIYIDDANGDGNMDIIAAGNTHASENTYGWHDASVGVCLLGDGKNNFRALSPSESGIFLKGNITQLTAVRSNSGGQLLVASANSGKVEVLKKTANRP